MPIRQIDIAHKLGTSRIAVSKALADHVDISAELKARVRQAAEKMGYIPNLTARNLQAQKTNTIGVVVPDISNSFFSFAIHGIMDAAAKQGYQILLSVSRENAEIEENNILTFLAMRVDGLLVAVSKDTHERTVFDKVRSSRTPLVFFDRSLPDGEFSSVGIDDYKAAKTLIEFVLRNGYDKIAHLAGSLSTDIGLGRYQGFRDALTEAGIKVETKWVVESGFSRSSGYEGCKRLLALDKAPQVIFAVNDRSAQGAYAAIREASLSIPDDIGVVAFGHKEFAELLHPTLTIIDSPPNVLGQEALNLLLKEIQNPKCRRQKIILNTNLAVNDSLIRKRF